MKKKKTFWVWETVAEYLVNKVINARSGFIFTRRFKRFFYDSLLIIWFLFFNPAIMIMYFTLGIVIFLMFLPK